MSTATASGGGVDVSRHTSSSAENLTAAGGARPINCVSVQSRVEPAVALDLDTRVELEEIIKQKEEIELKLAAMNEKNLQRLLHVSPSPEALPETEKMELVIGPPPPSHHQAAAAAYQNSQVGRGLQR